VPQNLIVAVAKSAAVVLYEGRRHGRVAEEGMASDIRWLTVPDIVLRRYHTIAMPLLFNLDNGWRRRRGRWRIVWGGMSTSRQHHERQP
jgi:hypothetical protein